MKFYPIAKPYITKKEKKYVMDVLDSGRLSLGPMYKLFEKKFAQFVGTKYACAVSSGTAGLHLAMVTAGIKAGDEIITSPFSFVASANCIEYVGAKPVFVDIDPESYNMDPKKIEEKITKKTKAILVVHIFGQATDMKPVVKIAKKYHLPIIEDACESLAARYHKKNVGTFGMAAVFAFYPNKQMTTGEGGMIVTNIKKIYEMCSCLRNQGRTEDMQWLNHKYLGYNYRLDEMSAAVGLAQLEKINFLIRKRQEIAAWYTKHLDKYKNLVHTPRILPSNTHTWFVYVVKIQNRKIKRNFIIQKLQSEGVSTKPYLPSIHLFDFYRKKYRYKPGAFPISENVSKYSLALPFYIGLKEKDIIHIVNILTTTLKKYDT